MKSVLFTEIVVFLVYFIVVWLCVEQMLGGIFSHQRLQKSLTGILSCGPEEFHTRHQKLKVINQVRAGLYINAGMVMN